MLTKLTTFVVLMLAVNVLVCEGKNKRAADIAKGFENGLAKGRKTECDGMNIICDQGDTAVIKCDPGLVIHITNVVYGNQVGCGDAGAFNKVSNLCDGQSECIFMVNDKFFNGTNCPNNVKESFTQTFECVGSCAPPRSCSYNGAEPCQCDTACVGVGDCCFDFSQYCNTR